jgi:hypothetical protein
MRKIINSAFVSLDGVTEDPSSWATFDPDSGDEAAQALQALDGMLMGRGTYEYFADVMPQQTGPYADAIYGCRSNPGAEPCVRANRPGVATSPPGLNHIRARVRVTDPSTECRHRGDDAGAGGDGEEDDEGTVERLRREAPVAPQAEDMADQQCGGERGHQ